MGKRRSVAWDSSRLISETVREKIGDAKSDPHWLALVALEFLLTLVLVGSIIFYLDSDFRAIEYPFNLIIFAAISYIVLRTYSYTEAYRNYKGLKRRRSFRIFAYEFAIFLVILFSAFLYQDPAINIIPYPFNFVAFVLLLIPPVYLYINDVYWRKESSRQSR